MVEDSASNVPAATGKGMGSTRFKLIMRYKQQANELAKVEAELHKLAKNLALTSDCLNESSERQEFFKTEAEVLTRKAEKTRLQIEQEKADKEIIIEDLNRLYKVKEKLAQSGKASFKRRVTQDGGSNSKGAAAQNTRSASTSRSKLIQPKQVQGEAVERTLAQKSTVNLRGGSNRRAKSVSQKNKKGKDDAASTSYPSDFQDLGLSGASYTPIMFNN